MDALFTAYNIIDLIFFTALSGAEKWTRRADAHGKTMAHGSAWCCEILVGIVFTNGSKILVR